MPDYGFIANTAQPGGFTAIKDLLGVAGAAQQLQSGGLSLQKQRETLPADIARAKAVSDVAQTEAQERRLGLTSKQMGIARNEAAALALDPDVINGDPVKTIDALAAARSRVIKQLGPENAHMAEGLFGELIADAHKPGAVVGRLRQILNANAGPAAQSGVINNPVTPLDTGGAIVPVQLQPGAPGGLQPQVPGAVRPTQPMAPPGPVSPGGTIPKTLSPGATESATTDILGRPAIQVRDPYSGSISYRGASGDYKPIMTLPPDLTPEGAKRVAGMVEAAPREIEAAAKQHFNNEQILRLASSAFTGTGGSQLARALNTVGLQATNNIGADTASLKHFLALQVQQNAEANGLTTDAGRALAERAVLPSDSPEKAVKSIARINDALLLGRDLKNRGMLKAVQHPNNDKDVLAARDFDVAWSENFDPNVMRLMRGEREEVKRDLGADGLKALLTKYRNLKSLSETGRLP